MSSPERPALGANVISLPKGGGAVAGMGESFPPDLFTGTGNFSVPIAVPPGRSGLLPSLTWRKTNSLRWALCWKC